MHMTTNEKEPEQLREPEEKDLTRYGVVNCWGLVQLGVVGSSDRSWPQVRCNSGSKQLITSVYFN